MASWIDVFSLVMTTLFFVGSVAGVLYVAHTISSRFQSTKESLEHRGITLSRDGISLKTEQRFDREAYINATQRGFAKVLSAATVGPESQKHTLLSHSHSHSHSGSSSTSNLVDARAGNDHEKRVFGVTVRRSRSDGHGEGH